MVFQKSHLTKFILCSLIVHVSIVMVLMKLEYSHEHQIPVEITFSMGATGDGKSIGEKVIIKPKPVPKTRPVIKSEIKSDVVTESPKPETEKSVSESAQGEGGTGTNIGTGKSGEGYGSKEGIETAKSKYFSLVAQTLNKSKRYPRQAYSLNQEGTVVVRLKLDKKGKLLDVTVVEKAPFKSLTNASLEAINSIKKFPPIPDELGVEEIIFNVPIEYKIQM